MQNRTDPLRRCVGSHSEYPFRSFNLVARAPPRDKGASQRGIDRHGVIQYAAQPGRCDHPAIGAAILVEPSVHFCKAFAKAADRNASLIRQGKRRSASMIISLELAAIAVSRLCPPQRACSWQWLEDCPSRGRRYLHGHVWPRPPLLRCQRDQIRLLDSARSPDTELSGELERGADRSPADCPV